MKGLPQGRKYLEIIISRLAPKKADQLFQQRSAGKAYCNFSIYQFYFTSSQADNQGNGQSYHQAKARPATHQRQQTS